MGCAPSIHVSQSTGVVYCRDDIRESPAGATSKIRAIKNSRTTSLSISEVVSHISASNHQEALPTEVRISRSEKSRGSNSSTRGAWIEVETQTQEVQFSMEKGKKHEINFGPMKIYHQPMETLLVFGKEDKQAEILLKAANQGGYRCKLCFTSESAMEYYYKKQPEVVIIDLRTNIYFEGETLCRNIRATRPSENTIIVGLTKYSTAGEDNSVLNLLRAGFNRRITENLNPISCLNELIMLDYGEVTLQCKIRASSCLFSAMEHVYDGIEIHSVDSEKIEFQYVNPAYEKVTGFWRTEIIGNNKNSLLSNYEVPRMESHEGIAKQLSKGNSWEGICFARRKNGDQYVLNVRIVPVVGSSGKVTHHVLVKRDLTAIQRDAQIQQMHQELQKLQTTSLDRGLRDQFDILHNGGNLYRRQSTSTTRIEAPITKVINMLNAVQENSPVNVVQVLEKVIDILRSTELFNPFATDKVEEKGAQNDLVDGLMSTVKRRHSGDSNMKGHLLHRDSGYLTSMSNQILQISEAPPEVQEALESEHSWEFDIIKLEKVSNKRPLYYLGLTIFNRFNVCKFLNISEDVLRNWLQLVEANYHASNSYHNSTHAADVLHATACFLQRESVKNALEPLDEISALIAAVVHDVDHPGFTNSFLCNAGSELAVLYNDIAVLESHHAALAFKLTARDSKSNILKNLDGDDFKVVRQAIIDMIMATEMKQHFEHLSKFDNSLNKRHVPHDDTGSVSGRGTPESTTSSSHVNPCTPENRTLIRRMIIKCADIANPARPRPLCYEWAYRIAEEYFRQSEEEKRRDLPIVMPVFDRATCNVPRSQVLFIDYFVIDLYTAWDKFANVPEAIEYINDNYGWWKTEADRVDSEREAAKQAKDEGSENREEAL